LRHAGGGNPESFGRRCLEREGRNETGGFAIVVPKKTRKRSKVKKGKVRMRQSATDDPEGTKGRGNRCPLGRAPNGELSQRPKKTPPKGRTSGQKRRVKGVLKYISWEALALASILLEKDTRVCGGGGECRG